MKFITDWNDASQWFKHSFLFFRNKTTGKIQSYYITEVAGNQKIIQVNLANGSSENWTKDTDSEYEKVDFKPMYGLYNLRIEGWQPSPSGVLVTRNASKNFSRGFNQHNTQISYVLAQFHHLLGLNYPELGVDWNCLDALFYATYPKTLDEALADANSKYLPFIALNLVFGISFNPIIDYGRFVLWKYDKPIGFINEKEVKLVSPVFLQEVADLLKRMQSSLKLSLLQN